MKMMLPDKLVRQKILNDLIQIRQENEEPSYCYTWEWEEKCICSYELCDYAEELKNIEMHSFVKRKEVYSPIVLNINKKKYYVRIESYGHSKKSKILQGPNYLALALNKMLYDYVYVFLEEPNLAEESLKQAISEYQQQQIYNQAIILIDTYEKFFKKKLNKERKVCEEGRMQQLKEKQLSQLALKDKTAQLELGQQVVLVQNSKKKNKKKKQEEENIKSILKQKAPQNEQEDNKKKTKTKKQPTKKQEAKKKVVQKKNQKTNQKNTKKKPVLSKQSKKIKKGKK